MVWGCLNCNVGVLKAFFLGGDLVGSKFICHSGGGATFDPCIIHEHWIGKILDCNCMFSLEWGFTAGG